MNGEFIAIVGCFITTWALIAVMYYKIGRLEGKICNGPDDWRNKIKKTQELEK